MSQHSIAYQAARHGAALLDRSDRGRIVLSGADRRSYLNGLLTNDIESLAAGRGCYSAYLTAHGRMIADMWLYELGDVLLLVTGGDVKSTVLAKLDQFIFSEDVQLGDVSDTFAQIAVVGPRAAPLVASLVSGVAQSTLDAMTLHANLRATYDGTSAILTRIDDVGVSGFDLYVDRTKAAVLSAALRDGGAVELDADTAETLRVESGTPLFHRDMDEETIPLEAGIEQRAISFTKGCYVGQEVIIRVLHRGHGRVARKLVGLRIEATTPPGVGTAVRAEDKEIGAVTSAVVSQALQQPIALAYMHRDFAAPGTRVTVGAAPAEVAALPFVAEQRD